LDELMPVPTVAGNWKMNTTVHEATRLAAGVQDGFRAASGLEVVLCPPFLSLVAVRDAVLGSPIKVGAQNMHFEASGAFTGEIGPLMLQGICDYVILGHSERRQIFGEADDLINRKVKAAFEHGLRPILCVGETLEQREAGRAGAVVAQQLRAGLAGVRDITGLLVAYEPVWAIGTGRAATPEIAAEIMGGTVQASLTALFGDPALEVPLLYGGSVTPANVASFVAQRSIHGALVGGASLEAQQFLEIARLTALAKV
jgi:triosephosphate isomerase